MTCDAHALVGATQLPPVTDPSASSDTIGIHRVSTPQACMTNALGRRAQHTKMLAGAPKEWRAWRRRRREPLCCHPCPPRCACARQQLVHARRSPRHRLWQPPVRVGSPHGAPSPYRLHMGAKEVCGVKHAPVGAAHIPPVTNPFPDAYLIGPCRVSSSSKRATNALAPLTQRNQHARRSTSTVSSHLSRRFSEAADVLREILHDQPIDFTQSCPC